MENIYYSPQLIYKQNYSYTNVMNRTPQINIFNPNQNQYLSGIKEENYNNSISNNGYVSYKPLLTKIYSASNIINNNGTLNLNHSIRPSISPIMTTNNNTNNNLNLIRINTLYQNKNNPLFSVIKTNYNIPKKSFYTPQTLRYTKFNKLTIGNGGNSPINPNRQIFSLKQNYENHQNIISPDTNNSIIKNLFHSNSNYSSYKNINTTNNNNSSLYINNYMSQSQNNLFTDNNNFFNKNKKDKTNKIETRQKTNFTSDSTTNQSINQPQIQPNLNFGIKRVETFYQLMPSEEEENQEPKENFDPNEFIIKKRIGEGTYGKTYLTQWKKNNRKYAMKKVVIKHNSKEQIKKNREKTQIVMNFIKKTKSKGVIKIYGDLLKKKEDQLYYYVLMEMAERDWEKELFDRQKVKKFYPEKELFQIMAQLIKTLSLMQKNHITHRDIKPQNILIIKGLYKISDFGEARTLIREGVIVSRIRGTELYMSPILFRGLRLNLTQVSHNTYKSDVFSLGMCFLFAATLSYNILCDIRELNNMKLIREKIIKYLGDKYTIKLIDIVNEMVQLEENNRPDFITLEQKYFKYFN